jgi:hypothetical protein
MDRFALFPTPLFVYDVPNVEDMNCELGERLRAEAQASPSVRRANVGGWHSPPDLALRADPCYRAMLKMIVDHVGTTFTIRPRPGMLVVFPGWLQHYVHPYRGTRPRIAIACNVTMSPMERETPDSSIPVESRTASGAGKK